MTVINMDMKKGVAVTTVAGWFDDLFKNMIVSKAHKNTYKFPLRVIVPKFEPPRAERFEYMLEMGMSQIEPVLLHQPLRRDGDLFFCFPERWMSVHEQRAFMQKLNTHPQVAKIKRVDIVTQSVIMISDFPACMVRIYE